MKNSKKRIISMLMALCLFSSSIGTNIVFAARAESQEVQLNSKQRKLLSDSNVNIDSITIVNKEDIFTNKQLALLEEEDKELKAKGLYKGEEVYYIKNNETMSSRNSTYNQIVYSTRHYNSDTKTLNDNTRGMKYWLDVTWNVLIGTTTKYFWIASTVFALNPSQFSPTYKSGDMLTSHSQYVYHDKTYWAYDKKGVSCPVVRTSELIYTHYSDLYTMNIYNEPVRDSSEEQEIYYTEHYDDYNWIDSEVYTNINLWNGLAITYDKIK